MSEEIDPWKDDRLGRRKFGELLLACLQAEASFSDEAFVVALTGKFGSGKSYFLNMWKRHLELKSKGAPTKYPLVVTINAWRAISVENPSLP
jgi:tRNA A37 threonylcarbamoyladenosine biosynthesis protein TsaE